MEVKLQPKVEEGFIRYLVGTVGGAVRSHWPEWSAGILLGVVNILFLAVAAKPFTIYTGIYVLGSNLYSGFSNALELFSNPTSLGDIGLLLGAFTAALVAGEFRLRGAPLSEYSHAFVGGVIMALGVTLAWGCNWGGFLSAITALSLHGYAMLPGLVIGGWLGARYLEWRTSRMISRMELELELEDAGSSLIDTAKGSPRRSLHLLNESARRVGLQVLALAALASAGYIAYAVAGGPAVAMLALGFTVGVIIQRSRFCFATAFRDLLGGPEMARSIRLQIGIALAIMVGATGAALLKYMGYVDPSAYIKYVSIANFIGGVLFGFGMVIAGSCASGMLWRIGEGHVKAVVALAGSALTYPIFKDTLRPIVVELTNAAKVPLFSLPGGYVGALSIVYASMALWIVLVLYLAYKRGVRVYG